MTPYLVGFTVFSLLLSPALVRAQEETPNGAYYVVQEFDTLWDIAVRFNVPLDELELANDFTTSGQIAPGDRLLIPGLAGFRGTVDSIPVPVGETVHSLSRRYQLPLATLVLMNRMASPAELYAGSPLILPADRLQQPSRGRALITPGISVLELAVLNDANPWSIVGINQLAGAWAALPGDVLLTGEAAISGPGALSEVIQELQVDPAMLAQGETVVVKVVAAPGLRLAGSLTGRELRFFPWEEGYVALQGIHTLLEPGLYPLNIRYTSPDKAEGETASFSFSQSFLIRDGEFPFDPPLIVDPETIDPAVTVPEDELWAALGVQATPEKGWQGPFASPVPVELKGCWTSLFGNRRSFNGSPYSYFHSGLDFCGGVGTELYAPAAGEVVFTGPLTVRGNATVIDHGWGVYTAYDHQSEIFVQSGDLVQPGQLIGLGGATGRVTGPHLHWEVWVGGVQVDPVEWLDRSFP